MPLLYINRALHDYSAAGFDTEHEPPVAFHSVSTAPRETQGQTLRKSALSIFLCLNFSLWSLTTMSSLRRTTSNRVHTNGPFSFQIVRSQLFFDALK